MSRALPAMTTATGMGGLPQMLEEAAGTRAVRRVFDGCDLPPEVANNRHLRIPMEAMLSLFAAAGRASGDRLLGLKVGLAMSPSDYGIWMDYSLAAPTLRQAIARLSEGINLHQSGPSVSLRESTGHPIVVYAMPAFHRIDKRQHSDHVVPTMLQVLRAYLGAEWLPEWVAVDYPRDANLPERTDLMPVAWRFGAEGIAMPIPRSQLDTPRPLPPGGLARLPSRPDLKALMRAGQPSLEATVRAMIALDLIDGKVGIDNVARRLKRSVRSLQRDLGVAGTHYSALLEEVRCHRATELLAHPGASIADVAFALGYGDPANFTRAYRKWMGSPPSVHRMALP